MEAALASLSGFPNTARRCSVASEPRRKAKDALRPDVLALVNGLQDLPLAKLARRQLMASTKTEAAQNLGVCSMMGFLWEALVKAPKAPHTFPTEAAGLKRWPERPTAKELKMIKESAAVTPEKEDQAFLLNAEPSPEPAPSLRRA